MARGRPERLASRPRAGPLLPDERGMVLGAVGLSKRNLKN